MDIKTPEFGQHFLSQFSSDVTKYDYTVVPKEKNPLGHKGITLLIYDGKYNVKLLYNDLCLVFLIEDGYYQYINHQVTYDSLSQAHFDYINDMILYFKSHEKKLSEMITGFGVKLPINYIRQQKLNTLV